MHELFNSYETKLFHALIIVNSTNEINMKDESNLDKDKEEFIMEKKIKDIKNTILFDLLPQRKKQLEVFHIFDEEDTNEQLTQLRQMIMEYVKYFA